MSMSDDDLLKDDLLEVTTYNDDKQYMRVAKKRKMESDIHGEATRQFIQSIDDKLFCEMAKMNSEIDRVHSFEENGQQLVDVFLKQCEVYENRMKVENEKSNKLCEEFQNFEASDNETTGAALREFEQEKQKFMAKLVDLRRKEKDVLVSIADHIKEVNSRVKMRRRVHQDLQDRMALEGRRCHTATAATTSVVPPSDPTATATATASEASPSDPTAIATASDVTPSVS